MASEDERVGAEIAYGPDACREHSVNLMEELGFPKGVLPLKNLEECGRVRETGFVWMKMREPFEHVFEGIGTRVRYAREITAYVEKFKMKKMTGVRSKQTVIWVAISEMSLENESSTIIHFKTPMGIGKSFPVTAFMTEEKQTIALQ